MTLHNKPRTKTNGENCEAAKRILVIDPAITRRLGPHGKPGHRMIEIDFTHDLHGACRSMCDGRYDFLILGSKPDEVLLRRMAARSAIDHGEFRNLITAVGTVLHGQGSTAFPGALAAAAATIAGPAPAFALLCDPVNAEPIMDSLSVSGAGRAEMEAVLQRYMKSAKVECRDVNPGSDNHGTQPRLWLFPVIHQSRVEALLGFFPRRHMKGLPARLEALRAFAGISGSFLTPLRELDHLRRRNRELESIVQIKTNLESNLCHECRSLLSVVRGYSRQILEGRAGVLSDMQRQYVGVILRNTSKLLDLVCHSIPFALEQPLQVEVLDLCEIWQGSLRRLESQIAEKALHVTDRFYSRPVSVAGDCEKLCSAFDILAGNCVQWAATGNEILADCARGPEGEVTFRLSAAGIEISPPDLDAVLEHGDKTGPVAGRPDHGRTAALAMVRDIVWLHGGQISVTSHHGAGTVFALTLPSPVNGGADGQAETPIRVPCDVEQSGPAPSPRGH